MQWDMQITLRANLPKPFYFTRSIGDIMKGKKIDPWGSELVDYERYFKEFGLKPVKPLLKKIRNPSLYMRRGIDFGHRDLDKFISAKKRGGSCRISSSEKSTSKRSSKQRYFIALQTLKRTKTMVSLSRKVQKLQ